MSAEIIRVDHEALEKVAGTFNNQAQATNQMLQEVRRAYQPLKNGGWIGRGAAAFFAEMDNKIFPAVRRLAEALAQADRTTSEIRQLMHSADEDASANFKTNGAGAGNGALAGALGAATAAGSAVGGTGSGTPASTGGVGGGGPMGAETGTGSGSPPADRLGSSGGFGRGATTGDLNGSAVDDFGSASGSGLGNGLGNGSGAYDALAAGNWSDTSTGDGNGLGYSADDNFFGGDPFRSGQFDTSLLGGGQFGDGALGNGYDLGAGGYGNDYGIPQDWLAGVTDALRDNGSLNDYMQSSYGDDYGIPRDWLDGVKDAFADRSNALQDSSVGRGGSSGGSEGGDTGSGGGTGGGSGSGGGEPPTAPEKPTASTPTGGGGSGGGGSMPQTNVGERARSDFSPRSFSTTDATAPKAVHQPKFQYQGVSGGAGLSGASRAPANFVMMGGTPAGGGQDSGGAGGTPLLLAVASPFVALLGKAIKKKLEN